MPAPSTPEAFLDLAVLGGVLDRETAETYRQGLHVQEAPSPEQLAENLVRDGRLTDFQARNLLAGRWRGFLISGKYRLLRRLGAGGMGAVYLCEHIFMRRRVALKLLPPAWANDPDALERFRREAEAVGRLDHPNIVRAHDLDREGKLNFLVLEYVDGCNLHDFVERNGPLSVGRAAQYLRQAAQGLDHAHQAGLVHRDIKPGNLIVDHQGIVKLLDLGLAQFFDDHSQNRLKDMEAGDNFIGTADYLAPEQVVSSHVDIRADIYSLGATLYYLLTGRGPFQEGTVPQKLIWHQVRQPRPVHVLRPDVPVVLEKVLEKMMAKEPGHRFQIPAEVVQALEPWSRLPVPMPTEAEMPRSTQGSGLPGAEVGARSTAISRSTLSPVGGAESP